MNFATTTLRWLFGVFYSYIGGAWFVHQIIGKPWITPPKPARAEVLVNALTSSGLVDPLIASTCLVGGLLLLFRRTAPLGIAILAPLVFGIFLFHLCLTGDWLWGSIHFGLLIVLAWLHRSAYKSLWSYGISRAA